MSIALNSNSIDNNVLTARMPVHQTENREPSQLQGRVTPGPTPPPASNPVPAAQSPGSPCYKKCYSCCDKIKETFKRVIEFLAYSVNTSENVQCLCKFGKSTIGFFKYALKAQTTGFNNLREQFEIVDGALDVADWLTDLKDWFIPKFDPADGRKKFFFNHVGMTKWKIISKIVGTGSKTLGVVKFLVEVGLLKLGQFSAHLNTIPFFNTILRYSPLRFVKDSLTVVSSTLDVVHQGITLHRKRAWTQSNEGKILKLKLEKWKAKENLRSYLALSEEHKIAKLAKEFRNDVPATEREQRYLTALKDKYLATRTALTNLGVQPRREVVDLPERKWETTKANYENGALIELNKQKCHDKIVAKSTPIKNNKISQNKNWLAIAFQVAKITAIVVGLAGLVASATCLPFFITLATLWFVTSSVGMVRLYYGFKHQNVA